jgi:outer membrane protein assembly factor BamE
MRAFLYACAIGVLLAGCQYIPPRLGVYKLDINQGNYITEDQVQKLRVGQTRQQVRLILGTPLLADPFHANRWDYVYEFERQGRSLEHYQLSLYFVDEKLARWENGEMPPSPVEVARSGGGDARLDKSLSLAPKTGETNWLQDLLRKLGWWE